MKKLILLLGGGLWCGVAWGSYQVELKLNNDKIQQMYKLLTPLFEHIEIEDLNDLKQKLHSNALQDAAGKVLAITQALSTIYKTLESFYNDKAFKQQFEELDIYINALIESYQALSQFSSKTAANLDTLREIRSLFANIDDVSTKIQTNLTELDGHIQRMLKAALRRPPK